MKGCPIEQNNCPTIANENDTFTKQRIPDPRAVATAPIITPFLIPF